MEIEEDGYYKIYYQDWWEDEDSKTGWTGSGWNEEKDFEIVDYIEVDKYGNATKALFKYTGAVFLGLQHAAYNIHAGLLYEFIEYAKKHNGKTFEEIDKIEPEFSKLNNAMDKIEEKYITNL